MEISGIRRLRHTKKQLQQSMQREMPAKKAKIGAKKEILKIHII